VAMKGIEPFGIGKNEKNRYAQTGVSLPSPEGTSPDGCAVAITDLFARQLLTICTSQVYPNSLNKRTKNHAWPFTARQVILQLIKPAEPFKTRQVYLMLACRPLGSSRAFWGLKPSRAFKT